MIFWHSLHIGVQHFLEVFFSSNSWVFSARLVKVMMQPYFLGEKYISIFQKKMHEISFVFFLVCVIEVFYVYAHKEKRPNSSNVFWTNKKKQFVSTLNIVSSETISADWLKHWFVNHHFISDSPQLIKSYTRCLHKLHLINKVYKDFKVGTPVMTAAQTCSSTP